ncbi:MAG: DUF4830 domain-containing protein [Clostridia bacterium]|nr:DUF4830 domain-containing protein [Clostridia bacterium]
MFICSVRASTLKFAAVAALSLALLVSILVLGGDRLVATAETASVSYVGIDTNEKRMRFLESFGWKVGEEVISEESFQIPERFDRVLSGYNEIQKAQGLDLSRYRKKKVTRFVYEVLNYEGYDGKVYATLVVYRDRVIAADIASADPRGFISGLEK